MAQMRPRALLLATTAATALTSVALAAPNLVTNGGFETGDLTGWVNTGMGVTSGFPNSGTYSAFSGCVGSTCVTSGPTGVGGDGSMYQTINLQPGIYQVQFALANPSLGTNEFGASIGNNTLIDSSIAVGGYSQYTFYSAASGGPTNLAFAIQQDPSFMYLDDISVVLIDDGQGNNIGAASQTVASQNSREFMDRLFDRFGHSGSPMELASAGEVMVASNDGMTYINGPGNYRAFISFYGDHARWDDGDARGRRYGVSLGVEWAPCPDFDIGVAAAVGRSYFRTETAFTLNHGDADERAAAIYANWSPVHSSFYATGVVGYGWSSNDFTRDNGFGQVVALDVDSTQWFGGLEVGFDLWKWSQTTLTPFARIDGARVEQDGYAEFNNFGVLVPAVVASKDQTVGRSLLGLRATTDLHVGPRTWQLSAKAAWQHEFDRDRSVTFTETTGPVSFSGVASGAVPVQNSAAVGASLEAPLDDHASLYLGYNGNFGDGQSIHSGEAGIRVTW